MSPYKNVLGTPPPRPHTLIKQIEDSLDGRYWRGRGTHRGPGAQVTQAFPPESIKIFCPNTQDTEEGRGESITEDILEANR